MRELWLARIYFFVWIGGIGFYYPFLNVFYREQGLSGTEIGLILTMGSAIGLVSAPLWGRWSDSGARLTRLLQLGLVASAALLVGLSQQALFLRFAALAAVYGLASAGLFPLSDTLALRVSEARRAGYGSIRVWGSAGWAIVVLISGWVMERTGLVTGFFGGASAFVAAALILTGLAPAPIPHVTGDGRAREGVWATVRGIAGTRALWALALALIVRGALSDGHLQFGNIYLEQLGASTALIGVASMVAAAVEVPGMFIADRVVKKIGARRTLLVSFFITGGKLFLVLAYPSVWTIMVTRATEGIAFSMYVIGMLKYITERASSGQMTTILALFSVTLVALVQILGAPIGGIVFDVAGAYWLYALAVVGNFAAGVILFMFTRGAKKQG